MAESRQVRRARERQERKATFDRVHGQVLAAKTVRHLWITYAKGRLGELSPDDPAVKATIEHAFYAGATSMLELMQRVSPEDITEEQGVEMLNRIHEELHAYADRSVS
jgi:hypothetical protein